ncbi:MAG: hypothetical protein ACYTEL_01820 [Planctomycetota bacterium]|jgi:hypothetical protein
MKTVLSKGQLVGLLMIGLLAGGCGGRLVNVKATQDICRKSVEVHLVGVNRFEKDRWETTPMSEYWRPDNQLRNSAKEYTYVMKFGQGPCEKKLEKKDPIRSVWKSRKAEYLFLLADLPGIFKDLPGDADARRLRIPAPDSECWSIKQTKIDIMIETSNIVSLTLPKSKCE